MANTFTDLTHLKIPLEDVVNATNNFDHKNVIGEGDLGKVYKGQLLRNQRLIRISARRLDRKNRQGHIEFWTEISALSDLKHTNIVSLIGFCDEKEEKIIVNEYNAKGSLFMYLSDPTFTWMQRLTVCRDIAEAIRHIHRNDGQSYYVIHCNINSSTILLDHNWVPKLSGFEYSIKHPKDRKSQVFLCDAIRTAGYMDPAIEKTGGVTHKTDIYTFGVVMFELLCGRKAFIPNENNKFLAPLARVHYENDTLPDIIHPELWNRMTQIKSFWALTKAAYSCLKEERTARPDASRLVSLVFGAIINGYIDDEDEARRARQATPGYFPSQISEKMDLDQNRLFLGPIISDSAKVKKLDHLRIRLEDMMLATNNFEKQFGMDPLYPGYVAELECFDKRYLSLIEGKNTGELPKKKYRVRITSRCFEEHMLQNVIETLSNCEHPNIESFLGFCENGTETFLVFEYVSYNYLEHYLEDRTLTWKKRLAICVDIAHGLQYLHSKMEDQKRVIHSDIGTRKIVLNDDYDQAMIVELDKAIFLPPNQDDAAIYLEEYDENADPEIAKTRKVTRKSDVYSFGVVLLHILCGESIYEKTRRSHYEVRVRIQRWFNEGIIKEKVLPLIKEDNIENHSFLNKGPNEDSLKIFLEVAYQCLAETQNERPSIKTVVKKLKKALLCQENHNDPFRMPIEDIKLATKDFCKENFIGGGGFGRVYKGEVAHGENGNRIIVAKRLDTRGGQGEKEFYDELQILYEFKHENVIGLVGYSNEKHERVIVYEYAPRGSLEKYLNDDKLSWRIRLQICIDVANGLAFLHGGVQGKEVVIHRDIKAANILLFDDWKAKVADFGLSLISTINKKTNYTIDHVCGTRGYIDPVYEKLGFLTVESDIYSFGVVLFEILYGRSTYAIYKQKGQYLPNFVRYLFEKKKQDELVFEAIKKHIVRKSLTTFQRIAYKCLHPNRKKRPTSKEILEQLQMALAFQEENKM